MHTVFLKFGFALCLILASFGSGAASDEQDGLGSRPASAKISFTRDIIPILSGRCFSCHGPDEDRRQAGLDLSRRASAVSRLDSGARALVPNQPAESELLSRVRQSDDDLRMPPPDAGPKLDAPQIDLLATWIEAGAEYQQHWSFAPVRLPELPIVQNQSWCRSPLDQFVLARLEHARLEPAPEAGRYRLARRLYLDLTGRPPSPAEVDTFVSDSRTDAYQRLVDRLLDSPHYGEHWARMWLDLARYADSQGYSRDPLRVIWRYRDWVIDAFNRDLPFDEFTIEQLAADLLPDPKSEQLLATAFHRNTMTNSEGGTIDEEFRVAAVMDRVNTTIQVWMGLTMGCAQCHSHKYDPISHEDYYRVFAIFNQTEDADHPDERPTMPTPTRAQQVQMAELEHQLAQLGREREGADAAGVQELERQIRKLQQARDELKAKIPTTPIMRELPLANRRRTHILRRGSYLAPGQEVTPDTLSAFGRLPAAASKDRLALARWLVSRENPLTARVLVNRYWEQFFGRGLVASSEDFGTQGTPPSHPLLLDWLAVDFVDHGWSLKQLCRTMVLSATYRQSSRTTAEKKRVDPDNRLLSRGARYRLTAEQIRDQALAVGGLLSTTLHGPSVRPPQPKMHVNAAFGGPPIDWEPSHGGDRYRRAVYIFLRRVSPYPSLVALDATNRAQCTIRRTRTNTPVGAFVTLNDPVFIEAAQGLARSIASQSGPTLDEQVVFGFRRALSRPPREVELRRLATLSASTHEHFVQHPAAASIMAGAPELDGQDVTRLAAWTVVANALLNLDEFLTRN